MAHLTRRVRLLPCACAYLAISGTDRAVVRLGGKVAQFFMDPTPLGSYPLHLFYLMGLAKPFRKELEAIYNHGRFDLNLRYKSDFETLREQLNRQKESSQKGPDESNHKRAKDAAKKDQLWRHWKKKGWFRRKAQARILCSHFALHQYCGVWSLSALAGGLQQFRVGFLTPTACSLRLQLLRRASAAVAVLVAVAVPVPVPVVVVAAAAAAAAVAVAAAAAAGSTKKRKVAVAAALAVAVTHTHIPQRLRFA
eukprot:3153921-Rhodomonas_salina.1